MKFYDYRCKNCEEEFEKFIDYEKRDKVECPKCGSKAKRLPSAPGFTVTGGASPSRTAGRRGTKKKGEI